MNSKSSSLGSDAIRLTSSKVITFVITMGTTMILSRFRTLEEYGTYSEMLLVVSLVTTLLMLGLPNSINFFFARAETQNERRQFLSVYYSLSTGFSVVIGVVLVLSISLIEGYFHNSLIGEYAYFLALYPWTHIIQSSIENVLVVYKRTDYLMKYRFIVSTVNLGSVLAVQWLELGFSEYMIVYIGTNCAFAISVYFIASRFCGGLKIFIDKALVKAILVFSIPIGLASVVGTLNSEIDKLLIGNLMDTEQLSIYTNAAKELPLAVVATSITAVVLPELTRMLKKRKTEAAISFWGDIIELTILIVFPIVAIVFTYAEEVMSFLYSAKYLPGVNVFRIYTLTLIFRVTYFGIILNAVGETNKILCSSIGSLVLNSIMNPVFYYLFGMIGPAITTFIATLAIQLLQLKMTSSVTNVPFLQVYPWRYTGIQIVINSVFAVVFWGMKRVLPIEQSAGEFTESIILGVLWVASYMLIMGKMILLKWKRVNSAEGV